MLACFACLCLLDYMRSRTTKVDSRCNLVVVGCQRAHNLDGHHMPLQCVQTPATAAHTVMAWPGTTGLSWPQREVCISCTQLGRRPHKCGVMQHSFPQHSFPPCLDWFGGVMQGASGHLTSHISHLTAFSTTDIHSDVTVHQEAWIQCASTHGESRHVQAQHQGITIHYQPQLL